MSENTIFIQIASYRDPQLVPTIRDCIENAEHPSNLVFGICRQYCDSDPVDIIPEDLLALDSIKVIDVIYTESKGVCWARNQVQQLYNGEKYTLQLDSHHRFAKNWDTELITMLTDLQAAGHEKPLLTAYAPSFDPDNDPQSRVKNAMEMKFDRFIPEGAIFFLPQAIDGWREMRLPKPARFYSAHMCFTLGQFATEVQHDPEYYFHGEEISIAVRAYTHGYDLFHPHKPLIWHEYTRKNRTKHWDDHKLWHTQNTESHLRNRKLFEMDNLAKDVDFGVYDFGNQRTLSDYENYAGISFSKRSITQACLDNVDPVTSDITSEEWEGLLVSRFKHCIDLSLDQVPLSDYDFWCVAFQNSEGKELYRLDAGEDEINNIKNPSNGYCKIWREFDTAETPKKWIVWPHSKSEGWQDQLTGTLA